MHWIVLLFSCFEKRNWSFKWYLKLKIKFHCLENDFVESDLDSTSLCSEKKPFSKDGHTQIIASSHHRDRSDLYGSHKQLILVTKQLLSYSQHLIISGNLLMGQGAGTGTSVLVTGKPFQPSVL
jgi:hypothetical protein